jgi:hypothetical protein
MRYNNSCRIDWEMDSGRSRRASRALPASDVADVSSKVIMKFCKDFGAIRNEPYFWLSAAQRCNLWTASNAHDDPEQT